MSANREVVKNSKEDVTTTLSIEWSDLFLFGATKQDTKGCLGTLASKIRSGEKKVRSNRQLPLLSQTRGRQHKIIAVFARNIFCRCRLQLSLLIKEVYFIIKRMIKYWRPNNTNLVILKSSQFFKSHYCTKWVWISPHSTMPFFLGDHFYSWVEPNVNHS